MNRQVAAAMVTGHLTPVFTNGDSLCALCVCLVGGDGVKEWVRGAFPSDSIKMWNMEMFKTHSNEIIWKRWWYALAARLWDIQIWGTQGFFDDCRRILSKSNNRSYWQAVCVASEDRDFLLPVQRIYIAVKKWWFHWVTFITMKVAAQFIFELIPHTSHINKIRSTAKLVCIMFCIFLKKINNKTMDLTLRSNCRRRRFEVPELILTAINICL